MKIIYLWDKSTLPTPTEWVEFRPLRAAYVEDDQITAFNLRVSHPYYNVGIRKKMYFVLTESSFFTLPYIDRVEGENYYLRSLVRIKAVKDRDYEVIIASTAAQYKKLIQSYTDKIEFDDVIVTELKTSDPQVETLYYHRGVLDVVESLS